MKLVPVRAAALIVTGALPVDVNVTGCVDAAFTVTLPNARLAALIVNCGLDTSVTAVPMPLRLITAVLFVDESLSIVSCPAAAPLVVGSNRTCSVTDWPGFRLTGNAALDTAKPAPVRAAELIVTGAVPVEVNVTGCVDTEPTVTSPKVKLAALTVNCGVDTAAAAVPVPLRFTTAVLLVAESLWICSRPAAAPVAVGSNCTLRVADCFGFRVTGKVAPDIVKPGPVRAAELMVTGADPVDVSVTERVDVVPTGTLPNANLAALTVSPGVELLPLAPTPTPLIDT